VDSVRAVREHPGGILLPVAFTTAELEDGHWRPTTGPGTEATPQGALIAGVNGLVTPACSHCVLFTGGR
jgi:hypothetical protein